jgi:hypothetical protein
MVAHQPFFDGIAHIGRIALNRRLPVFAKPGFRQALSTACATHARLRPACLVLYDVTVRREAFVVRLEV